ncbi:MAG: MBL fold metallo-hydrolase [Anaerolineales bacterium]|jgi:glyoxylase-like metal-dependent hydrolase (beta-lactamase superfamily II)
MKTNKQWHIIPSGRVWVDPGGAFGLVPKPLWNEHQPLDSRGRIPMDLNCLLIHSEGKNILIDTGMGDKLSEKKKTQWGLEWPEGNLIDNLADHGICPEDIHVVINTHLHSDHCGGNTKIINGEIFPTFPRADYWVQRMEFAEAILPNVRTKNTYFQENFKPLWKLGRLKLLHGNVSLTSEVRCIVTPGHSAGHQCVIISLNNTPKILFLADLSTYTVHMTRTAWVTAYDIAPIELIRTKASWQKWALENEALLVFQHDSLTRLGKLIRNMQGRLEINTLETGSYM